MEITRMSPISGQLNTMNIPVTDEQLWEWENGALIQEIAPELTPAEREFMISGILEHEWSLMFPDDE